jgi:hypothetical protein
MDTQNDDPDMLDDPNRINNRQINDMNRLESEFKLIETEVYKLKKKLLIILKLINIIFIFLIFS